MPPCDRCRRLRMDCVKNLTSCAGCTRKHARCHWRDVSRDELGALDHLMDSTYPGMGPADLGMNGYANGDSEMGDSDEDDSNPLEDLEALGQKEEQDREDEEGLRNARELARQGYYSGADQDAGQANGDDDNSVELEDPAEQAALPLRDAAVDSSERSQHSDVAKVESYDYVDDVDKPQEDSAQTDLGVSRGFLAVNQSS